MTFTRPLATLVALGFAPLAVAAQDIPCDTARFVVPYGAGGGSDLLGRVIVDSWNAKGFKPQLQVINITGQGGNKGASEVQEADPDGCTMLYQHEAILASYITGRVPFSWDGFTPVAMATVEPAIFAASPNAPFDNLDELLSYASENPGDVLAAASMGSNTHFIMLMLQNALDVQFNIIGYEGGRERMTALLSDTVQVGQVGESDAKQYFPDQLKPLGIFADERSTTLPDLPTAVEQGHNFEIYVTRGVMLPAGASDELVALYADQFEQALQDPKTLETVQKMGNAVRFLSGGDYVDWWAEQAAEWETTAKEIGIWMAD